MSTDADLLARILDSMNDHIVYCDENHVIRYMNAPARARYEGKPAQVGRSIFDCHTADSVSTIIEVAERLRAGEDEICIAESETCRVYMRAVRALDGAYLGYWERHEPVTR